MDVVLVSSTADDTRAFDFRRGVQISSLKSNAAAPGGTAVSGDIVISAQAKGTAIHAWVSPADQPRFRSHVAEHVGPLALTTDGALCAAGGTSGKIYMWDVATGALLSSWNGHYKEVRALAFSGDDSFLYSGGEDGMLSAWNVLDAVDNERENGIHAPSSLTALWTASEHTLPVTGIHAPKVGARIYSASLDRTGKVWDAACGRLLLSVVVGASLTCVVADAAQYFMLMGGEDGRIFKVDLGASAIAQMRALVRSAQAADVEARQPLQELKCDGKAVASLACAESGDLLISGHADGSVRVWHLASRQCLRTLGPLKGPVSSVVVCFRRTEQPGARSAAPPASLAPFKKFPAGQASGGASIEKDPFVVLPAARGYDLAPSTRKRQRYLEAATLNHANPAAAAAAAAEAALAGESNGLSVNGVRDKPEAATAASASPVVRGEKGDRKGEAAAEPAADVKAMAAKIAKLESDVRRWEQVNNALLQKLEAKGSATGSKRKK